MLDQASIGMDKNARSGIRTHTEVNLLRILSPVRLPIPPSGHKIHSPRDLDAKAPVRQLTLDQSPKARFIVGFDRRCIHDLRIGPNFRPERLDSGEYYHPSLDSSVPARRTGAILRIGPIEPSPSRGHAGT